MTGTQKEKQITSFKYQLELYKRKNRSENDPESSQVECRLT